MSDTQLENWLLGDCAFTGSCSLAALKAEILAQNDRILALMKNSDAAGLTKMYTEDCSMMQAGRDVVNGRDGTPLAHNYVLV